MIKDKLGAVDEMSISKVVGMQTAYMVLDEFEKAVPIMTAKVFPTSQQAQSYAQGQEIVKVNIVRQFD